MSKNRFMIDRKFADLIEYVGISIMCHLNKVVAKELFKEN